MLLPMTEVTAPASPPKGESDENPPANDAVDLDSVLRQVDDLIEKRAYRAARTELDTAVRRFGEPAKLLTRLAAVTAAEVEPSQAMTIYRLAVATDPGDPEVAGDYCKFLHEFDMQRMAMDFVADLPPDVAASPPVREVMGAIYRWEGWAALAVDAYGDPRELSRAARSSRRQAWWLSGGPVPVFRRWVRRFDNQARRNWDQYAESLSAFDDLDLTGGFAADRVRGEVDDYLESWALTATKADLCRYVVGHAVTRYPVVFSLAWATVFLTLNATRPAIGAEKGALVATAAAAAGLVLGWPLRAFANAGSSFIFQGIRGVLATSGLVAAGIFLIVATAAPPAWPGVTGVALLVASAMFAVHGVALNLPWLVGSLWIGLLMRNRARAAVLERLLDLLSQVRHADVRNDLGTRDYWIFLLEAAAKRTERDLPRMVPCRDPRSAEWARERAAGAAAALRVMKRHIAAPTPAGWDRLTADLRHDASALASGNFGLMRWSQPPSAVDRRKSVLRTALTVAQRVVIAAVPVVVVFALQPVLGLSGGDLVVARAGTIFWAFFYLVVTIDPGLVNKVQQAHDAFNEVRSIGSPKP
jgi:hypothetical protein